MKVYILGKILVVLIILAPVLSFNSCKKQEKCGCDGDKLFSITDYLLDYSQLYVLSNGSTIQFSEGYDTYIFCNPNTMYEVYKTLNPDEQILLSGDCYWDCNYVTSASQSSYYSYYRSYNINVTAMKSYLYGK
jgi:hypothetical protein